MKNVKYLIIGAGITGLTFASKASDYLVIEKENKAGGLCRTIKRNGYVWDFSGHFFHFKEENLKKLFIDNMHEKIFVKNKNTKIKRKDILIDFPFQKNIHQLPKEDFIDCLYDLYFRNSKGNYRNFEEMLYGKFGNSITNMFLKPYNEKLYACELNSLEVNAMGRFFPYANLDEIIGNMKHQDNRSYNETFLYPESGAETFVNMLLSHIDLERLWLNCTLLEVDAKKHIAFTTMGEVKYEYLINTTPLNEFCELLGVTNVEILSSNKVLVFNIGFNKKSQYTNIHWIYYPEKKYNFYRVGFYDNILDQDRLSVYVEIGFPQHAKINKEIEFQKTINDLRRCGIIDEQRVIDYYSIIINPAYVHINKESENLKKNIMEEFKKNCIYSIGRYGKWSYCSIEDCMLDAIETLKRIEAMRDEIKQ